MSCKEEPFSRSEVAWSGSRGAELLAANATGDQHGMKPHCAVWSSAVSAVAWSLPQLYL